MKKPSRHEIEVRWKGAQVTARGLPATLCVIGAMLLLTVWALAEGQGRIW